MKGIFLDKVQWIKDRSRGEIFPEFMRPLLVEVWVTIDGGGNFPLLRKLSLKYIRALRRQWLLDQITLSF